MRFYFSFDYTGERERKHALVPLLLSKRSANYLREILLEIIGVQINVTVRHFTHTDAHCIRETTEGAKHGRRMSLCNPRYEHDESATTDYAGCLGKSPDVTYASWRAVAS